MRLMFIKIVKMSMKDVVILYCIFIEINKGNYKYLKVSYIFVYYLLFSYLIGR